MNLKERTVRNILVKSGWLNDYYYIIKVMYSCMNTSDKGKAFCQLSKSFYWGMDHLTNKWSVFGRSTSII